MKGAYGTLNRIGDAGIVGRILVLLLFVPMTISMLIGTATVILTLPVLTVWALWDGNYIAVAAIASLVGLFALCAIVVEFADAQASRRARS